MNKTNNRIPTYIRCEVRKILCEHYKIVSPIAIIKITNLLIDLVNREFYANLKIEKIEYKK